MYLGFPMAIMANTFAMTVLMIVLGVSGESSLAADIGMVHGATLALFFAFSANARSLILNKASQISAKSVMLVRLVLLPPLTVLSYFLSVGVGVESGLAIILILRRSVEWLGEVHLSEMERLGRKRNAEFYLFSQAILLAVAFGWLMVGMPYPLLGVCLWALLPLFFSFRTILNATSAVSKTLGKLYLSLLPHLGSSAIIGITVYVFRLLVLFTVGKETAGDLFTAFAIGGLTGSVFANALGASITFHEQQSGTRHFPLFLRWALNLSLLTGIFLFVTALVQWPVLETTRKSYLFWLAVGLSLVGGVVMVHAQRIRFRLLQNDEEHDVFGPDVMMNVLLLAIVPFAYYLLGREFMGGLYLLSAILAYIFYTSSEKGKVENQLTINSREKIKWYIAIALLFPLFFQVNHGLFRDPSFEFDSGGRLFNLPVPISVLACYAGILLLGHYKRAYFSFITIFLTCVLMLLSVVFSISSDAEQQEAKLVLMVQFILPMFALVLGQVYYTNKSDHIKIGKVFLYVLAIIIPLHLIFSWNQGLPYLVPSLGGLFSIYQHLQYVPVIFVSAYLVSLFSLWHLRTYQFGLVGVAPLMAIYVAASLSMLAIGLLLIGFLALSIVKWALRKEKMPAVIFAITVVLICSYLQYSRDFDAVSEKFGFLETISHQASNKGKQNQTGDIELQSEETGTLSLENVDSNEIEKPSNVFLNIEQRTIFWKFYGDGVLRSPRTVLFGHGSRPDRTKYPSAHNYYLDFMYNFGLIALLPVLSLLIYSCLLVYRHRKIIYFSCWLIGLCLVVFFLLFIDDSFKVGLRQPYPGIFTFFLWGLLLSRLLDMDNARNSS